MINKKINKKILSVWKKHFGASDEIYAPIFHDEFKTGGIIFVGMNPSFDARGVRKLVRGTEYEKITPDFYRWRAFALDPKRIDTSIAIGRLVTEKYVFFKRMHEIAQEANMHFQHLDLFVYRQTKQNEFMRLVRDKSGTLNTFGYDQLKIFLEVLKGIHPKIIVVSNAGAGAILKDYFKKEIHFDDKRGFHQLSLNDSKIPIFFSSMLSGQRALDNGSYERLKWHIREAINLA